MAHHEHPGEKEPRAHGGTHHERRLVDLNSAPLDEIASLPMVGRDRAEKLVNARPFKSWEDVQHVEGIDKGMVDDLKSGGARIGEGEAGAAQPDEDSWFG